MKRNEGRNWTYLALNSVRIETTAFFDLIVSAEVTTSEKASSD
jgi:hypothetical protein